MKRSFYIAGVQFRPKNEIAEASKRLKQGAQLSLIPEPENKFDPNAIKIIYKDYTEDMQSSAELFLGYVPKKFSSEVAGMLSIGAPVECIVDEVDSSAKTYEMFKVTVQILVEEEEDEIAKAAENDSYEGDTL